MRACPYASVLVMHAQLMWLCTHICTLTHMDFLLVFTYARPVVCVSPSAALLSLPSPSRSHFALFLNQPWP